MFLMEEVEVFGSPGVSRGGVIVVSDGATYGGQLFLHLSIVEMGLLIKVFGRRTGGFSFPNDRFLWRRSLFRGFLLEWEWNGVVYIIRWSQSPMGKHQR